MSKSAAASVLGLEKPEVLDQKSIDKALGILKLETGLVKTRGGKLAVSLHTVIWCGLAHGAFPIST